MGRPLRTQIQKLSVSYTIYCQKLAQRARCKRTQEMLPSSEANTSSSDILLLHFVVVQVSGVCALAAGWGLAQAEHHGVSRVCSWCFGKWAANHQWSEFIWHPY